MFKEKPYNILILHENGFYFASTEKLLRQMAKILSSAFQVFFAYSGKADEQEKINLERAGVKTIFFSFDSKQKNEPYNLFAMKPSIIEIIEKYNIHCIFVAVFSHYQFPLNIVPASIPFVLISPFGHYASNGNVVKVYVSGKNNTDRILHRGVKNAELFFNPLEDFDSKYLVKQPMGEKIVFGRIGRGDESIFDPIALLAYAELEKKYPNQTKYIVVNPPPSWVSLSEELKINSMEFRPAIVDRIELQKFYQEIDVLAHARKDGETVGMAIAEAMLSGCPILTHKSHFHNEHLVLLDSAYSRFCEPDDVEAYFKNMVWMIENKKQIRYMGQLARKRALEIFSLEKQAPKIIADFKQACEHYYHHTFFGRVKGKIILFWENFKALPFRIGKLITIKFPNLYKVLRKMYYE